MADKDAHCPYEVKHRDDIDPDRTISGTDNCGTTDLRWPFDMKERAPVSEEHTDI